MKIGLISNPLGRRNRRQLSAIESVLSSRKHIAYERLDRFGELRPALGRLAEAGVELLIINGGDGTVAATLTEILERKPFTEPPGIAILPGGTSNTIAGDIGLTGRPVVALKRFLDACERDRPACETVSRALMRIEYDPERSAVCGMFFGSAAICDAIELRRRLFPQRWLPDAIAAAMTLMVVLANAAARRTGVLSGRRIGITVGDEQTPPRQYTILIATTLRRILLGGSPFWGGGAGAIRFTTVRSPARGLVRHAYRLLYGRDRERLPADTYASADADRIVLDMDCPFNLDGEFYQPAPGHGVVMTSTAPLTFLR